MSNRIIALVTLASFLVFSWSCYSLQEIKPEVLATAKAGDYEIRKIEKKTGEMIEYSDELPGQIGPGQITGSGMLTLALKSVEVESAGLEIISKKGAGLKEVMSRNGRIYGGVKEIEDRGDKSILHILEGGVGEIIARPISFSEIQKTWAKKFNIVKTLLYPFALLGGIIVFSLVVVGVIGAVSGIKLFPGIYQQ
jgi:hypothetical protein